MYTGSYFSPGHSVYRALHASQHMLTHDKKYQHKETFNISGSIALSFLVLMLRNMCVTSSSLEPTYPLMGSSSLDRSRSESRSLQLSSDSFSHCLIRFDVYILTTDCQTGSLFQGFTKVVQNNSQGMLHELIITRLIQEFTIFACRFENFLRPEHSQRFDNTSCKV